MKNKITKAVQMVKSSVMEAVAAGIEPMTNDSPFMADPNYMPILRRAPIRRKKPSVSQPKSRSVDRRPTKKSVLCPASVAMCEAVALDEIGNFLNLLVPDTRYLGKKWSEIIDPVTLTRVPQS
ncbi:MAG: hypothetical protein B9S32_06240 [Verrucomicrobia bacterium Tous-C9LFEB]|nr:MAG: hypothetical protein B9S32_06240 [Verrucomicrobia bacterium Tous-C9LFEB]